LPLIRGVRPRARGATRLLLTGLEPEDALALLDHRRPPRLSLIGHREDEAVVSYIGRLAPAVAVPLASSKGSEPATELTSSLAAPVANGAAARTAQSGENRCRELRLVAAELPW
jgi:hypothetical protein